MKYIFFKNIDLNLLSETIALFSLFAANAVVLGIPLSLMMMVERTREDYFFAHRYMIAFALFSVLGKIYI